MLLQSALPEATRLRAEPLLLVQHVIASLRLTLFRPLDQGVHWPAVERIRGSLQWLWDHLGWTLPRVEEQLPGAQPAPGRARACSSSCGRAIRPPSASWPGPWPATWPCSTWWRTWSRR